ncbi:MAG: RNA methyltransferase [Bacteroidota bacterium]
MNKIKRISSLHNSLVKQTLLLKDKSRERKKSGLFVLEGSKEFQLATKGNYDLETVIFCGALISESRVLELIDKVDTLIQMVEVSREVYQKLAYRETTEGILAIAKSKSHTLNQLALKRENPLILVAEAPEKPGNIGALLRTADAADLDAVIIANPKTDLYNPNIIRSSVGCVFTTNIGVGTTDQIIDFLRLKGVKIYCAALTASQVYTKTDFNEASAIVVGTESTGLSTEWLYKSDRNIIIPMQGEIDSMNVSVSAAILIFEAKRQRG